jgi:SAM-dependent methyltransferase
MNRPLALLVLLTVSLGASGAESEADLQNLRKVAFSSIYGYTLANNIYIPSLAKNSGMEIEDRFQHIDLPALLRALDLKPGAVVLDVGAGSGAFSLPMARALAGSGRVYASELDGPQVTYMNEVARREGLDNFEAVKVGEGFDPFYGSKLFDRIYFGSVYQFLPEPLDYLGRLVQSLRPDTGRLFFFHPISYPRFSPKRQLLIQTFVGALRDQPTDSPLVRRLSAALRDRVLGAEADLSPDAGLHGAAVADLNAMLDDPTLPVALLDSWAQTDGYYDAGALWWKVEDEFVEVSRFLHYLYGAELQSPPRELSPDLAAAVRTLNYAALQAIFFPNGEALGYAFPRGFFDSEGVLAAKLAKVGLQHVATHSVSCYYLLLEFRRAPAAP